MARKISESQLSAVLAAIQALGGKANLGEISAGLRDPTPRRTLQRWLKLLVDETRLEMTGGGALTVYRLRPGTPLIQKTPKRLVTSAPSISYVQETEAEAYVSLSLPGQEIRDYVRRPLSGRHPVGYERDFLAQYEPNKTWYLGESLRLHLMRIGDTGELTRPAGTYGRAVLNRLLIDLSWSSSRLEGNTYSRLDTVKLIERGERAHGKDAQDAQMILNHKAAIEFLMTDIESISFDMYTFLNLHGVLSENLLADPVASGRLRTRPVSISGSVYRPMEIPQVIEETFREVLGKAAKIEDPFEQAFFTLVHIPYLQPFEDVNKRVSRLSANIPLLKRNLCPLTFIGVPEKSYIDALLGVYEMNRVELLADVFTWAYERSTREYLAVHKNLSEPDPIRLKYRREIHELVARVVREPSPDALRHITESAEKMVPEHDRQRFQEQILDDLKRLHEGVLGRYGLRPADYQKWKERTTSG
ncbi:MAG: Fic family protein [Chthoniobacterales bacterium]